ncbi:MAG: GDP-mannose 4,6-dehydratase, partial [Arenicellales bacterium]|nr:GDP-mannose 4,6-dehydratase [Arenicellales bacterium]
MTEDSVNAVASEALPGAKDCCVMVTGGAGFIGSAVIRHLVAEQYAQIINIDILTYAGNEATLVNEARYPGYHHENADIRDARKVQQLVSDYRPDAIMHLAAESHVDRSIDGPGDFISTNIEGTYNLLEAVRAEDEGRAEGRRRVRFHHISTDEVYGALGPSGLFHEESPYQP